MSLKLDCNNSAQALSKIITKRNKTLATAESCTGGLIGATLTDVSGSSRWFRGGIIAYHNDIKYLLLDVSPSILKKFGAVSAECVKIMVTSVAKQLRTDCAIAVSGIAGPSCGECNKPVGLVFIGIKCEGTIQVYQENFTGNRTEIRQKTVFTALNGLISMLNLI